jgi:hypothetical protein
MYLESSFPKSWIMGANPQYVVALLTEFQFAIRRGAYMERRRYSIQGMESSLSEYWNSGCQSSDKWTVSCAPMGVPIDMETLSRLPPPLPLICRLCPIRNGIKRRPPVKDNLRWKGSNSISNFHHHNINEGADNLHYVTGRSVGISGLLSVPMSMGVSVPNELFW